MGPIGTVPKLWPGETVVCIAGGPSLTQADVDYVRGKARVIVVNNGYQIAPWADVLYAADCRWWTQHNGVMDFTGLKYSMDRPDPRYGVVTLQNTGEDGLELLPTGLRRGMSSGYQAVNLAVHLGAGRIVLLGYDMQPGPHGEEHWHPNHNPHATVHLKPLKEKLFRFRQPFSTLVAPLRALRIPIANCSRATALTCFPRMPLDEALQMVPA